MPAALTSSDSNKTLASPIEPYVRSSEGPSMAFLTSSLVLEKALSPSVNRGFRL